MRIDFAWRRWRCHRLLPSVLLWLACGCSGPGGPHPRSPEYSDGFYNNTDQELTGMHITWEADRVPYRVGGGFLGLDPIGTGKVSHYAPDPIPPKVTVHWTTADGAEHQAEVEVASRVPDPAHFTGTIYFWFSGGGVRVIPVTYAELEQAATEGGVLAMLRKRAADGEKRPGTQPSTQTSR